MINPKSFISGSSNERPDESVEIEGSYSCPEQGCYKVTYLARFNERERVLTWVCPNGHLGRASI